MLAIFKALSDGNRLKVFVALTSLTELCACQVTEFLQVTGATASRHMSILISAGLVESRKEGRWVYYQLHRNHTSFRWLLDSLKEDFENKAEMQNDLQTLKNILSYDPEELCRKQRGEKCCP